MIPIIMILLVRDVKKCPDRKKESIFVVKYLYHGLTLRKIGKKP